MKEAEWLAEQAWTGGMVQHRGCRSERKRRLLGCAACRRVLFLIPDERYPHAVEAAERYADGLATEAEMQLLRRTMNKAWKERALTEAGNHAASAVLAVLPKGNVGTNPGLESAVSAHASVTRPRWESGRDEERRVQCDLIRDIFGNPFQPIALAPEWLTEPVRALAQAAYDDRELPDGLLRTAHLRALADGLAVAGCTKQEALSHLRGPGPHVRGCWVVDLVLGKE